MVNYGFPVMGPPDPLGPWFEEIWIYIMSESFHVIMTFSSSVVHEKTNFKWSHPIFVIISLLKRNWSFIWTIQNPILTQWWFVPREIEIGLLVLEEDIFYQYKHM